MPDQIDGIIVEFRAIGDVVKVSAIDSKTGTEVVIQGPASAGEDILAKRAVQKLKYMLAKKGDSA